MGIPETSQLPSWQHIRSAIAAENERAQDFLTRILVPLSFCRTHGTAWVVVQVATPVRPSPFAKGYLNPPLTQPRQSKPFRGSRLKPSKADSRCDQKGKRRAICTVEADSPCIPQGKRAPDAGSRDRKTQHHKTARATRRPVQPLADSEVADLRRNYVDLHLPPAPSRTAPLAQQALDEVGER
jgi:hypothetical protein